jgi:hypothetical protein
MLHGSNWRDMFPQVEFAYNASRALGIEHTPFKANSGFSSKEPLDLYFSMRPSISVSQDASGRLRLLHEAHAQVRSVLLLHKDVSSFKTVDSPALEHRGQGVNFNNKSLLTRAAKQEAKGPTAWTIYSGEANWETRLHIETSNDITLTPCVLCDQPTTVLYSFATSNCPIDCP